MNKKIFIYPLLLLLVLFSAACSTKNDVDAFRDATYSLSGIDEMRLNGINLLNKKRAEDFSFGDAAVLFSAISENKLSAFSKIGLNVELGEGSKDRTMTVTQLKWQLLVDGQHTLSGLINEPVELHDGLNTLAVTTPIVFAQENGRVDFNRIIQLATLLSQENKENRPAISLQIKPTIQTSVGPFELPRFISINK